jgi:hypothetical protein
MGANDLIVALLDDALTARGLRRSLTNDIALIINFIQMGQIEQAITQRSRPSSVSMGVRSVTPLTLSALAAISLRATG